MFRSLLAALLLTFSLTLPAAAGDVLIHAGYLIDGRESHLQAEKTIVVRDGQIVEISHGYRAAANGDKVIDLRGMTVMPGLIDLHTHVAFEANKAAYVEVYQLEEADYAIRSTVYAERTLNAGFTTVRDVGDRYNVTIALKRAIAAGTVPGPRIFTAAKALGSTGGHADQSNSMRRDLAGTPGPTQGIVNSVEDARRAVRQRYKDGADLIKITATGGVLSVAASGQNPQFTLEELKAIVDTAADYGFHVAAHAHGTEGIKRAVEAGVRTIEHGTYLDDEAMAMMIERGTYLVPTLMAGDSVTKNAEIDGFYPEVVRAKASKIGPAMSGTFKRAVELGVPIAFGTDAGVFGHGTNGHEFRLMVDGGMLPIQAIESATRVAAEVLDMSDRLGTIEGGKIADIVAVPGNPLKDIDLMKNVVFVMKEGVVYKHEK